MPVDEGKLADEKDMLKKVIDFDGVRHSPRNNADLTALDKDLGLCTFEKI
jgi:hypothetical protein